MSKKRRNICGARQVPPRTRPFIVDKSLPTFQKKKVFLGVWEEIFTYALIALGLIIVSIFGFWWFSFVHVPHNFKHSFHFLDYTLFALLSFVVWYQIVNEILSWEVALFMRQPVPMVPMRGLRVALCTAFVPGKEPYDVLEKTLQAMVNVRYPHDTWLLDEGNDPEAKRICAKFGVHHYSRHGIAHYNTVSGQYKKRSKAGNYNSWFNKHRSKYDIVAQHDVDF